MLYLAKDLVQIYVRISNNICGKCNKQDLVAQWFYVRTILDR